MKNLKDGFELTVLLFKTVSRLSFSIWILLGVLTISSIVNGFEGIYINIIIGIIFILSGIFLLLRTKKIRKLVPIFEKNDITENEKLSLKSFLVYEIIFSLLITFFGLILATAAFHRIITEKLPIFG